MIGSQISVTSSEVGERVMESTLTVSSPFLEGIGNYTCVVENVVDTANRTAEVVVFCESLPLLMGAHYYVLTFVVCTVQYICTYILICSLTHLVGSFHRAS